MIGNLLLKSLQLLGQSLVEMIRTRMELVSLDVREARIRFVSILLLGAFTFLFLSVGIILGIFWLILSFWETNRFLVVGITTGVILIAGITLLITLVYKLRNGYGILAGSLAELDKDFEALGGNEKRRR